MKRFVSIIVCFAMIFSLAACGGTPAPTSSLPESASASQAKPAPASIHDPEIERAVSLGFVPEGLLARLDSPVTEKEMSSLLAAMLSVHDSRLSAQWKTLTAAADDKQISRDYGALFLLYAAELMGEAQFTNSFAPYSGDTDWDAMWASMTQDYSLFESTCRNVCKSISEERDGEELEYPISALQFVISRFSLESGEPLMNQDNNFSLRCGELMTVREAVWATLRLYESSGEWYTAEQAKEYSVPSETSTYAAKLAAVTPQRLPKWHGTSVDMAVAKRQGEAFFKQASEMGFNYVRLTLSFSEIAKEQDGTLVFMPSALKMIDSILNWCAVYQIHLCLGMHELPGYTFRERTILEEADKREQALLLWEVLSARYGQVPSSLLSYNLVNEPDSGYFTDQSYTELAGEWISVIRQNDKTDKLLVSDGMLGGDWSWASACPTQPIQGLGSDIAQTIHMYPWHAGHRAGYISLEKWPYEDAPAVNNFCGNGPLTLKGDFKAGTIVTVYLDTIYGANRGCSLVCSADGKQLTRLALDGFEIDKDGCTGIEQDMAFFGDGSTDRLPVTFTVPDDCKEITVAGEGDGAGFCFDELFIKMPAEQENSYMVPSNSIENGFVYETGKYTAFYLHSADSYDKQPPVLTINADGSYSVASPASRDVFDMTTLRDYIKKWADWSQKTGTPIICNEFGVPVGLPKEARVSYMKTVLDLFEEYGISWCIYATNSQCWTPIVSDFSVKQGKTTLPVDGSMTLRDGYWYDEPMLALFKEYQQK